MKKPGQHRFQIGLVGLRFRAGLSLFLVFDAVKRNELLLQQELYVLYGKLLMFGLCATVARIMFFGKPLR